MFTDRAGITTSVQGKINSALVCHNRPLREGEKPKRKGDTTIYESTGELNPDFLECIEKMGIPHVSVKHDGTSSMILRDSHSGKLKLYKRLDIRKGKQAPTDSLRPFIPDNKEPEICWIDITKSTSPADNQFLSGVSRDAELEISGVWVVVPALPCPQRSNEIIQKLVDSKDFVPSGTYELVGPKVSDHYIDITGTHQIMLGKKNREPKPTDVPVHVFVKHGSFELEWNQDTFTCYENMKDFIVSNKYEGLVFRFSDGTLFKVNRGHIGVEIKKNEKLRFI